MGHWVRGERFCLWSFASRILIGSSVSEIKNIYSRLWKYEPETIGNSEFLLDSSLIDTLEFDNDIFAAGGLNLKCLTFLITQLLNQPNRAFQKVL